MKFNWYWNKQLLCQKGRKTCLLFCIILRGRDHQNNVIFSLFNNAKKGKEVFLRLTSVKMTTFKFCLKYQRLRCVEIYVHWRYDVTTYCAPCTAFLRQKSFWVLQSVLSMKLKSLFFFLDRSNHFLWQSLFCNETNRFESADYK